MFSMKKVILLLTLTLWVLHGNAQKKKKRGIYDIITAPNCVQIKDSLFIDKTEMANIHWLQYLVAIKDTSSFVYYQSQKQDTAIVYEECTSGDKDFNYHNYPGTRFDPVVGVSYEQVVNFCKWRSISATEYINQMLAMKKKIPKEKRKILENYTVEFEYRLPTKEEWELAAGQIDTVIKSKGRKKRIETQSLEYWKKQFSVDTCFNTHWIFMFKPNEMGLYNMFGNVAEMVQEKEIAKGGHYRMNIKDIAVEKDYLYDRPKNWLGFRCVAIVRISPKNKTNP